MQLKKDKIISIEYLGEQETGDIEIIDAEGEHQQNYFLGNGINVHNSGAMNNYPAYKFGKAKAEKKELHPIITANTKDTYGLILYQEQVMQIVRELGDFNWEQTNTVRKVMSKSGGAEYFMKTFWPQWKKSCMRKGMSKELALKAFRRIMSMGSWSFNKSHSVSYAMVSYMCMWFKVHYPLEFVTAYLNRVNDSSGEKIPGMIREAQRLGIDVQEPNVNYSREQFVIHDDTIIAGLSDIKHVGNAAVKEIVANQPYKGLYTFLKRTTSRAVNKRTVICLIKAGAFDGFGYNKKELLKNFDGIHHFMKSKTKKQKAKELIWSCKGEERYTDQEEAQLKNSVSPVTVGKHIVEFYDDVTSKFASHIKLTKLIDIELDEGKQQQESRKRKRKEMFVIGQLTKVDLKRLSQEVKEVIDVTQEKRYALANFVDETDFIVLSFRDAVYERYEQKLFSWVNKVLLIQAECSIGWKKLYVNRVWEMDKLRKYMVNNRQPFGFHRDYLFKHPLHRLFGERLKEIRKKFNAKKLMSLMKSEDNPSVWAIGIISDIQIRTVKKEEYEGQKMYIVYFEDETFKASFMIYPSDDRYKLMKRMALQMYKEKRPFLLYCQRDYKLKPEDSEFKHITLSIDKRLNWSKVFRTPFIFKGEQK
jgi:DNA polymerase III alpha subunit